MYSRGQINVRERLPRTLLYVLATGVAVTVAVTLAIPIGYDSHAYWLAWRGPMYTTGPMSIDAYLYSPAFAQVLWPATQLPWPAFNALFIIMDTALLVWLLLPTGWWAVPAVIALSPAILAGNIFTPLAVMAVLGFRYPGAWALSALTKVAPTVMPVWWLARKEWRPLAVWMGTTVAVVVVSVTIAPGLWLEWLEHLAAWTTESRRYLGATLIPPLVYRIPAGVALVVVGARRDWRWAVPVAAMLCTPVFGLGPYVWLAAIPRINEADKGSRMVRGGEPTGGGMCRSLDGSTAP